MKEVVRAEEPSPGSRGSWVVYRRLEPRRRTLGAPVFCLLLVLPGLSYPRRFAYGVSFSLEPREEHGEGQEHERRPARLMPETPRPGGRNDDLLVETSGLSKRYGARVSAVAGLDLTVRRGEVYGFLGPNGSGKTTTLRMLLGLARPTGGRARVLGRQPGDPAGLRRVGALVGFPSFYPYLSGRDNLRAMASYAGVSSTRVDEVLETVELGRRAEDKVGKYPLAVKQRLGIAAALLKDPELLILDEPTSGLDPEAMADVHKILGKVSEDQRTVLLSSHLLGEVEQLCDRVGVVREGRMISEVPVEELGGRESLVVKAEPPEEALRAARALPSVEMAWVAGGALRLLTNPGVAEEINAGLVRAGLRVREIRPVERSLEEVFLQLAAREEREGKRE
jgi:ABC-type multidrug transport system ATPase subunit